MEEHERESSRERREKNIAKGVITLFCIFAILATLYIDASIDSFEADKTVYWILAAIAIGVGPKDAIQYLAEKAKK